MINGVVFQKNKSNIYKEYKGIEGDNWYLNDKYDDYFEKIFDDIYFESYYNKDYLGVLNDERIIKKYIELSEKENIEYRILLCETERNYPNALKLKWKNKKWIGYDYAYTGDDYYSAVFNDVYSGECAHKRKIFEFDRFTLNKYGLFQSLGEIKEFVVEREKVGGKGKDLEKGDFIIYNLYEVDGLL